jgi:YVTN family beta-propeller protein
LWVANHNDGTLSRIDPQANTVIATIPVGPGPAEIAAAGGSVWVANNDATLARVDPGTNRRVQLVRVGRGAKFRPIHAGGGSVWTLNTDGSISRLNSRTGAITATIPIKGCCEGDIWIASDAVWVTNVGDASVYRIDPSTNQVVKRFTVEKTPSGIALTNGLVWNTHGDTGLITWRSPDTGRTLGSVRLQGFVGGLGMAPGDDRSLWIPAIDYSAIVRLATG